MQFQVRKSTAVAAAAAAAAVDGVAGLTPIYESWIIKLSNLLRKVKRCHHRPNGVWSLCVRAKDLPYVFVYTKRVSLRTQSAEKESFKWRAAIITVAY